jgi:putative transposase
MKGERYSEEQIIGFLKEHEAGAKVADLTRRHGFSVQSFYRWKSKFGGMEVSEAKRLCELEAENARFKRLLAEAELDKAALKDLIEKSGEGGRQTQGRRLPSGWPQLQPATLMRAGRYQPSSGAADADPTAA